MVLWRSAMPADALAWLVPLDQVHSHQLVQNLYRGRGTGMMGYQGLAGAVKHKAGEGVGWSTLKSDIQRGALAKVKKAAALVHSHTATNTRPPLLSLYLPGRWLCVHSANRATCSHHASPVGAVS